MSYPANLNAINTPSSDYSMGSHKLTNLTDPSSAQDAATKTYVDNAVLGQNYKEACAVATTANLVGTYSNGASGVGATFTYTATGVDTIDGVALTLGMRVLLKNQASTFQNGIYTVTTAGALAVAGILTRSTDTDQAADWSPGDAVFVTGGTAQTSTTWAYTGVDNPTLGTDAITFAQVAGPGSFTGGTGITITGTSIAIDTTVTVDKNTAQTLTNKSIVATQLTGTSYTLPANNTSGTAAMTLIPFEDHPLATYGGTFTFNSTPPSTIVSQQYRWSRVGGVVTLFISVFYSSAGTTNTTCIVTLPSDCPAPAVIAGAGDAASEFMYPINGARVEGNMTGNPTAVRGGLRRNAADNGYEMLLIFGSVSATHLQVTQIYAVT